MNGIAARLTAGLADRYQIEREIGAGGMATVYLARDLRNHRNVALKVLKPELGAVLGVERFLSEIRVTANLQHPNLLPLFDSGEVDGLLYYVMPFVEGESLRARLDRERQLPVDEAIRIAVLVAGALDYAHSAGVIHRDLKPENILLSRGQPLVADFGIALAVSNAGGSRVTQTGLSLGTPQYMSPEQATGDRQIDARTDIYSLAAVLFEMLTGDPPHSASTVQAVIAKVLTERPASVRTSRPNVPLHVEGAIASALEKLPADRIATAGEFARALEGKSVALPAGYSGNTSSATAQVAAMTWRDRLREPLTAALMVLVAVLVAACAGLALWGWNRGAASADTGAVARFTIEVPASMGAPFSDFEELSISADGQTFVWVSAWIDSVGLFMRRSNSLDIIPVPGTAGAQRSFFSPDGKWIAFQVDGQVKKISLDGFAVSKVADLGEDRNLGPWLDNETLVLGGDLGIALLPASGGALRTITVLDSARRETIHSVPYVAPDGDKIFFEVDVLDGESDVAVVSRRGGRISRLGMGGGVVLGLVGRYLLYQTNEYAINAILFDSSRDTVIGSPLPIADGYGGAQLSRSGTLFTFASTAEEVSDLIALNLDGSRRVVLPDLTGSNEVRYSPDGRRIAMRVSSDTSEHIWIFDLVSHTSDRLTNGGNESRAEWSPDGKRILFSVDDSGDEDLWWQSSDGVGKAEPLQKDSTLDLRGGILSQDSQWLTYRGGSKIYYRRMQGDTTPRRMSPDATARESSPHFSRDGKWLTYISNETGEFRVHARRFPGPSPRYVVSLANAALEPMWSRDGKTIYYREEGTLIAASVVLEPEFAVTGRKTIATGIRGGMNQMRNYDLAPDGSHILLTQPRTDGSVSLLVVQNWAAEVLARLAAANVR